MANPCTHRTTFIQNRAIPDLIQRFRRDEAGYMHREVVREKDGYLAHRLPAAGGR